MIGLALRLTAGGGRHEASAQTATAPPPQRADEQEQRLRIVTNEVRIPLRVFDPVGRRVTDLTANEVLVIEDGVACPVTSLKREPANVMIVLDLSSGLGVFKSRLEDRETREKLFEGPNYTAIPRPIAREFIEILLRQLIPQNQIAVIQYADRVELLQDWTRDRDRAISSLRAGFRAGLKARFYDALALAATRLQQAPAGRRVLILVTDGLDSASVSAKQAAFEQITATGASVYVLSWSEIIIGEARQTLKKGPSSPGFLSSSTFKRSGEIKRYSEQTNRAAEDLKRLTTISGGDYWLPAAVSEMMLQKPPILVGEINSEYTLTYLSQKDQIDRVAGIPEIRLARPGLSVFTRQTAKPQSERR
ncbi:MAG TPA: VWA domain-containing protein [Blastocatellia bacterium]|nr:VWA domain-containing protein [Blastocatellia bacterium]